MKTFYTLTVGGKEYKLRLTVSAIMEIEKKLGKSLFEALEGIQGDMFGTVATIIWGAMQPLNSGFTQEKAVELIDDYIDEGNSIEDMMFMINGVFETSGFFSKGRV